MKTVYLDAETTGLHESDEIVELAIIDDDDGKILLNTLVKPIVHTYWPKAQRVHGISPTDVEMPLPKNKLVIKSEML